MRRRKILVFVSVSAVVLAAVIVLAPSVATWREQKRRIRCVNCLRQLGLAIKYYARDYGKNPITGKEATWHDLGLLYPSYSATDEFTCPSSKDKKFKPGVEIFPRPFKDTEIISYSYNRASKHGKALTKWAPSTTPLLADKKAGAELVVTRRYRSNHGTAGRNVVYVDLNAKWVEGVERLDSNPRTKEIENYWSDPPYTGEEPKKKSD